MEVFTHSTQETQNLALELAKKIKTGDIIALYGEMGAGKTTFTRFLAAALGVEQRVQSPTFVLARQYKSETLTINHLDLYRLVSVEELKDLDLDHFFNMPNSITLIEWPELAEAQLPNSTVRITFEYIDEKTRKLYVRNLH